MKTLSNKFNLLALITGLAIPAFSLLPQNVQAADKTAPTIVVAKTEASKVACWQPAMGEGLAQMLNTEVAKLGNFTLLEGVALDDLRAERQLGESGEISTAESVKKGEWKGADYTLKTTVTRFGAKEKNFGGNGIPIPLPFIGGGGFSVRSSENEVQIDWRIIDNASRQVVASDRAQGLEKGTGFNFSSWQGGGFSDNREFMDSALGKATMKALDQIVNQLKGLKLGPGARVANKAASDSAAAASLRNVKGTVKLVDGKQIWVSLGSTNGFVKGDTIKIYKPIEKRNRKGEVVATTYEPVAEIVLSKVQKDKSMGDYSGSGTISEDYAATDTSVDIESLQ